MPDRSAESYGGGSCIQEQNMHAGWLTVQCEADNLNPVGEFLIS